MASQGACRSSGRLAIRLSIEKFSQQRSAEVSGDSAQNETLITLTSDIVAAHVSNNQVVVSDISRLIGTVYEALEGLGKPEADDTAALVPAVSIRSSVKPDYIVCLEDGKKLKMLKRHLATSYGMSPAEYRAKWGLPADYPMVAPNYAEMRREMAKTIGLGRKPKAKRRTRKKPPVAG